MRMSLRYIITKTSSFSTKIFPNIALERDRYIGQSKRYDLVVKVVIAGPEGRHPFIALSNSHLMVGISQIKLGGTLSPT